MVYEVNQFLNSSCEITRFSIINALFRISNTPILGIKSVGNQYTLPGYPPLDILGTYSLMTYASRALFMSSSSLIFSRSTTPINWVP